MNRDRLRPLLVSAVRHFPVCDDFGFVFGQVRHHLQKVCRVDAAEADDALLEAAGAVFACKVDPETLTAEEDACMGYVAMVKTLLLEGDQDSGYAGFERARHGSDSEQEEYETGNERSSSSTGADQRPRPEAKLPEPKRSKQASQEEPSEQLEEGEVTD